MQWRELNRKARWACVVGGVCFGALSIPVLVHAANASNDDTDVPKVVTIKGEVVDLWCYLDHKGHGEKHKSCAVTCAEAGNPIGIVDASGNLYIAMGGKKHQPGRDILIDRMADTVSATGKLVKDGGLEAIYVTSVEN